MLYFTSPLATTLTQIMGYTCHPLASSWNAKGLESMESPPVTKTQSRPLLMRSLYLSRLTAYWTTQGKPKPCIP